MRDPVILPKAKQSIDRTTIAQHLLSDPRCPFTSTPLKIEECLPGASDAAEAPLTTQTPSSSSASTSLSPSAAPVGCARPMRARWPSMRD